MNILGCSSEDTVLEDADIAYFLERVKDGYSSICLKVFNYPYEYTVHMEEIENSCVDVDFGSEKAFEVEFGDWDDNGALEIHIWKLNEDYKMHNARVKFSLKEEPLCAALLSLW